MEGTSMRVLARWLALALCPVVLFLNPTQAIAGTQRGEVADAEWSSPTNSIAGESSVNCSLAGYFEVPDAGDPVIQIRALSCSTGWNISSYQIEALRATGPTCSFTGYIGEVDGGGTFTGTMGASAGYSDTNCTISELCIDERISWHSNPMADESNTVCVPWPLGAPPVNEPAAIEACHRGAPGQAPDAFWTTPRTGYNFLKVRGYFTPIVTGNFTVIVWATSPTYNGGNPFQATTQVENMTAGVPVDKLWSIGPGDFWHDWTIKGVQVVSGNGGTTDGWNNGTGWTYNVLLATGPPDTDMGGATWPQRCSWYWGVKIAATSGDDHDEPIGPVGGGTPEDPEPTIPDPDTEPVPDDLCTFDITQPTTWLDGGMCTLVGLAIRAFNFFTGGYSTLGGLLSHLFVPDPDSWDVAGLRGEFEDRPPGSVIMDVAGAMTAMGDSFQGASGCGLLADWTIEGTDAPVTCSNVSSVPGYGGLYGLVQLAFFALTGLGLFKMFAAHVGGKA